MKKLTSKKISKKLSNKKRLSKKLKKKHMINNNKSSLDTKSEMIPRTVAIDFGGVLSIHQESTSSEHRSTAINIPGSIEALEAMKKFGHKLYINSFCGRSRAIETRDSINKKVPGLFDGLYFVKSKPYKGYITKFIGADVMIDDTLEVLEEIQKIDPTCHLIWFTGDPGFSHHAPIPNGIIEFDSWSKIVDYINSLTTTPRLPDSKVNVEHKLCLRESNI